MDLIRAGEPVKFTHLQLLFEKAGNDQSIRDSWAEWLAKHRYVEDFLGACYRRSA